MPMIMTTFSVALVSNMFVDSKWEYPGWQTGGAGPDTPAHGHPELGSGHSPVNVYKVFTAPCSEPTAHIQHSAADALHLIGIHVIGFVLLRVPDRGQCGHQRWVALA